jgi:sodium:sulfate symporter-like transmembrane protein
MRNLDLPKLLPTAVVVAFTLMIWFVIPVPAGVSLNAWHLFALFVGTIVGIISNAMQTFAMQNGMSALSLKADICSATGYVRQQRTSTDPNWTTVALALANDAPAQELATQTV